MDVLTRVKETVKELGRRVVLPEGEDPRTIQAAHELRQQGLLEVTLLGDPGVILRQAESMKIQFNGIEIINPKASSEREKFVPDFMQLRAKKNITMEQAEAAMADPLYFGAMLVRHSQADASVAGAANTTGAVLRAALQVIGLKEGCSCLSSSFLMTLPEFQGEQNKVLMFGDCAVVPNPTPEQLASIAASTAETYTYLTGDVARVALLSFSTRGSAEHEDIDKVLAAKDILSRDHVDLFVDGELQLDAAIIPEIASRKAPDSEVAGRANVLIFPNLDAGNIGYKLVQRLAGATATGPIIQGLAKPANDLSRGCSADDIVDVSAIATLMRG